MFVCPFCPHCVFPPLFIVVQMYMNGVLELTSQNDESD